MYSGFIEAFRYCCEHEDHHMVPKYHQDIELTMNLTREMTKDDFEKMIVYLMACDVYLNNHYFPKEDRFFNHEQIASDLQNQKEIYLKIGRASITRRTMRMLENQLKDVFDKQKLVREDLRKSLTLVTRLYQEELTNPREWKRLLAQHWDIKRIHEALANGLEDFEFNTCMFHPNNGTEYNEILEIFPEITSYLKTLVKSYFRTERSEIIRPGEQISPKATEQIQAVEGNSHALIKRSKFKYEYIIGSTNNVGLSINNDDVIFCEEIAMINESYQQKINQQMREIVKDAKPRSITFDKNNFVLKTVEQSMFKKIVNVYKNVHA